MNIIKIEPTSENITPVINAALESIKDDCETIIEFAKGTYYFGKNGSFRGMFYPSNNQSCERSVVFPIIGKKNLTIAGNAIYKIATIIIAPICHCIGNSVYNVL